MKNRNLIQTLLLTLLIVSNPVFSQAPANAIILFDGQNTDAFGKVVVKEWLEPSGPADNWKITEEGFLEVVPESGSIITKQQFKDFLLHLEFRVLGEPINGGVYLLSRYEINIKDSYGQTEGAPCGALGNVLEPDIPMPTKNMALPPMEWQSFDIDFKAPRFDESGTVKIQSAKISLIYNGELIYENVEVHKLKGAAGRLGEAPTGPIYLQEHGAAYQFRNIWLLEK